MERLRGRDDRPSHRPEEPVPPSSAAADRGGAREDPRDPARAASVPRGGDDRPTGGRARRGRRAAPGDRARPLVAAREPAARRASRSSSTATSGSATSRSTRAGSSASSTGSSRISTTPRATSRSALVRAWRFGADDLRLGGIGEVEPYLERYNELTGREIAARGARLLGGRRQRRVGDRLRHAGAAPSDRPGTERRARDPRPARRRGRVRDLPPARGEGRDVTSGRPPTSWRRRSRSSSPARSSPRSTTTALRFRMLVALNALGIVRRELDEAAARGRRRAARARCADPRRRRRAGTLARVKAHVAERLRVASPRYLDRYS